jgi:hypothetical protein
MTKKNATILMLVFAAAAGRPSPARAQEDFTAKEYTEMTERLDRAWKRMFDVYYSPKTHLFYGSPLRYVAPASVFTDGFLDPDKDNAGYGAGMADCSIFGGVLLSMLADQYEVTNDRQLVDVALDTFKGLKLCATVHGKPGFVARGVCLEDGRSVCLTSSRDQYTHFVHGLWRYYHSPLSNDATRTEIRKLMSAVADRMVENVTPENDYDFLRADDSRDPRGICRMWNVYPHEAARLPMIYAAAWDMCRDEKYFKLYREYITPAIDQTLDLPSLPQSKIKAIMPTYTLLQMQSSLELLYELETDKALKERILNAMSIVARMGAERAIRIDGGEERWLCAAGEATLAQLMAVDVAFPFQQKSLLYKSIMRSESDSEKISSCRTIHLTAAFWRARKLGLLTKP